MCKTMFVLLVLSVLIANCFASTKVELAGNGKIDYDNENDAYMGQFPWFSHIEGYLESNILAIVCSGSIISSNWVMTEAFCGITSNSFHLYFGNTNFSESLNSSEAIISNRFITHPLFQPSSWLENNIGLIPLPVNIEFSTDVRAITLPWNTFDEVSVNTYLVGSRSNGTDEIHEIRWNFLQIITDEECNLQGNFNERIMCTIGTFYNQNQGPCYVNDGAVLAYFSNSSWIQIGIGSLPACSSTLPGLFTRVSVFIEWIAAVTGINF